MSQGGENGNSKVQQPKFQRVPQMLRGIKPNSDCYDPMVVSIGPYHHGKPELQEMERLKITMARHFFERSKEPVKALYNKVAQVATDAKICYCESSIEGLNDEAFTQMMFLDGSFVLQFIFCPEDRIKEMKPHVEAFVMRDLFLLENQLPFSVLNSLMSSSFEEGMKSIHDFIEEIRCFPTKQASIKENIMKTVSKLWPQAQKMEPEEENNQDPQPLHLLELFYTQFSKKSSSAFPRRKNKNRRVDNWFSYRSANELKSVGIHFEPSKTASFMDVKFISTSLYGVLRLPPIHIGDLTKSLLLNLVAYEMSTDTSIVAKITSYICFMDSLVDQPEDVKELRSNGILVNFLGCDQEVADLFNEISKHLVLHRDAFEDVKDQIQSHYKNIGKRWIAEWLHTHFSSPWALLAFLGASLALVLTAIQTYLSVFPTKG
ncbi:hypothetical protein GH714_024021 [Hevea brasiliensis]|nr:hypothetical protein GH714_024021 [Hevea brasiliensis]